jgi:hypothetical protein
MKSKALGHRLHQKLGPWLGFASHKPLKPTTLGLTTTNLILGPLFWECPIPTKALPYTITIST